CRHCRALSDAPIFPVRRSRPRHQIMRKPTSTPRPNYVQMRAVAVSRYSAMSREALVAELEALHAKLDPTQSLASLIEDLAAQRGELRARHEQLVAMQRSLEEARDRYADLFERAPVAYLTLDRQGAIVEVNEAASTLLGTTSRLLAHTPLITLVLSVDRA